MVELTKTSGGVRMMVKVVPGASRDRIVGVLGDTLKVAVSKPPSGGAANAAVTRLLAESLGVPASQVQVVRGHGNPRKQIFIARLTVADVVQRLALERD